MARLDPLDASAIASVEWTRGEKTAGQTLNRTRTIAHVEGLAGALAASEALINEKCVLETLVRATVIAAVTRRSAYEKDRLAIELGTAGLTSDMLEAIEDEDWTERAFTPRQKYAFRYAMMFDAGHGIVDAVFDDLKKHFTDAEIVQLSAICVHYGGLARLAIALSFELEN
jgi:alkylhydroperoxidase family enzyme